MDFALTPKQLELQKMVRDFAQGEVWNTATEREEKHIFDRKLSSKCHEMGITQAPFDKKWGGGGMDFMTYMVMLEEICKADIGLAATISVCTTL